MKIYLIPGQAYTRDIYGRIDLSGSNYEFIDWIEPKQKESFKNYAMRMAVGIDDNEDIILIGHSLGGLLALEISTFKNISKVILLSSMKSRNEMPFMLRLVKPLGLYVFISRWFGIHTVKYWGKYHDFVTADDHELFKKMTACHSNRYLRWSFKHLSGWQTPRINVNTKIVHIQGTKDKTFPLKKIQKPVIPVENGSHIMVYKQAEAVSGILRSILKIG